MIFPDNSKPVLGIDVGGVITGDTDAAVLFSDEYLNVPKVEGAFDSIKELNKMFDGFVFLVSKCKGVTQVKTRHWLSHHNFFEITGIPNDHAFFLRKT